MRSPDVFRFDMAFIGGAALPTSSLRKRSGLKKACSLMAVDPQTAKAAAAAAAAAAVLGASIAVANPARAAPLFHFRGEKPASVGLVSERYLQACPPTPNCIGSMGDAVRASSPQV